MFNPFTDLLQQYHESIPNADPDTKDWFLVQQTPVYVWMLTAFYLTFIYLGPKYMKNKEPFQLQWFLVLYNLGCVALSVYMSVEIILTALDNEYNWLCQPYNDIVRRHPSEYRMKCVLYWYFFSKAVEFIDTFLMVLRKKNNQITFLHVFHHASMLNIWWWVMMFIPSGLSFFSSLMNCLVHVVMYSYYGLSAIPSMRGKLWWKSWITKFQLMQFIINFVHTVNTIRSGCDFPNWSKYMLSGYMILLFTLFSNFYMHAYTQHRKSNSFKTISGMTNGHTEKDISLLNGTHNGVNNGHTQINGSNSKKKK